MPANTLFADIITTTPEKIKAAYIYRFTQFVTWPETSSDENLFNICVLGQETVLKKELNPINGLEDGNKIINIRYPETTYNSDKCHILYISDKFQNRLKSTLSYLKDKPILTVSSIPYFAERGGIIGFILFDDTIRLTINRESAFHANIILNSKLLEVAKIVNKLKNMESQP